jgi:hypothetical protein
MAGPYDWTGDNTGLGAGWIRAASTNAVNSNHTRGAVR